MSDAMRKAVPPRFAISPLLRAAIHSRFWRLCLDIYPLLAVACIPWSTSGVGIFMAIWFVVLIPTLEPEPFLRSLRRPASLLPLMFVGLAVVGTLWAEGPWVARLSGINP